ncbi:MAG: dTDP-4-dehydrorhamnose reductase [Actinobacteria bacterium]|nr:dTDP-4-dehydrorhamnose reductase [Actinomycetota bacterium]
MTRFLIAGAGGMFGTALQRVCRERGAGFDAPPEGEFDITDRAVVALRTRQFFARLAPGERGVLVNAAAFTNVERAEEERDLAALVNAHGAFLLAEAAREVGLGFVHVSTDFVFDGRKHGAYSEEDIPNPLSMYGITKLAGEYAVARELPDALIVRTAWVFGEGGVNFPTKILDLASRQSALRVVTDEVGSPTYTADLAAGIVALVEAGATGIYHLTGSGSCSRYDFAAEVLRLAGSAATLETASAADFPTKAARPANSVLDCSKAAALGVTMPPWQDGLARFMSARAASVEG